MIYYENGDITDIVNAPVMFGMTSTDVTDIFELNIKTIGLGIEPVNNELQLFMKEGKLFAPGVSYRQDPSCPNLLDIAGLGDINTGTEIIFYNRDYSFRDIGTDILEVWDNNGTVEAIPGNDATIHRLYISGITNPKLICLLGQNKYTNTRVAKDNLIIDGTNTEIPQELQSHHFLGWICVRNGSGDFSNFDRAWIANPMGSDGSSVVSTVSHDQLTGRDLPNQHVPESISGLEDYFFQVMKDNTYTQSAQDVTLNSSATVIDTLTVPQLEPGYYFFNYDLTVEMDDDKQTYVWTTDDIVTHEFRIDSRGHLYTPFSYGFPLSWDGDGSGGPADLTVTLLARKRDDSFNAIARFADIVIKKYGDY
jgi:hypothetical protein